jgi:hypothetical protein
MFLLLLLQVYIFYLAPSRKQKQFAFLFPRRKGKQRLKRREKENPISYETSTELDYSNHLREEILYDSNEKTYKKSQEQIQGSSSKFRENLQGKDFNSEVYKEFKKTVEEALEFSSTQQWKASSDRQYIEAKALLETEKERNHSIYFLRKILKSTESTKNYIIRTLNFIRKSQRRTRNQLSNDRQKNQINEAEMIIINTEVKKESSSTLNPRLMFKNQECIYRQLNKATIFLGDEQAEVLIP